MTGVLGQIATVPICTNRAVPIVLYSLSMARSKSRSCKETDIGYNITLRCQLTECAVVLTFGQYYHEPTPADVHFRETLAQVRDRYGLLARISGRGVQWVEN